LYSYKLKKPGCRTQIICDMNEMVLWVSKSEFYCVAMDGGYPLSLNQFYQISKEKGKSYSDDNFIYPIKKDIGVDLTYHEAHYNEVFGSFRSNCDIPTHHQK
ncbi:hypothetical protein BDC45DRAFT_447176, partial [Circinella umbellata]